MNCCDDYGNCNQGRDCPVRKCPSCPSTSDKKCTCQKAALAWILVVFIAVMLAVFTVRSCA